MILYVEIPVIPPGINETYLVNTKSKQKIYKSPIAVEWENKATLIIGSAAGIIGWEKEHIHYTLILQTFNAKYDVDASVKLVTDMITQKLGFDDKWIKRIVLEKNDDDKGKRICLTLAPYQE